jgi:hypothetical protein
MERRGHKKTKAVPRTAFVASLFDVGISLQKGKTERSEVHPFDVGISLQKGKTERSEVHPFDVGIFQTIQ